MDLQIGSTVGDYQVIGILGAGGMGKVYKVRNVISDRVEAMKVLLPDLANAPDLADRFLREIKVQASLEHPNIAALHTALRVENQLLMLMELVEGQTLEQKLKEEGRLPVASAVSYISQILAALEYAHAHGVVHRDIKPANMMLTPAGVVKLMDFGIAKGASDHKLTMTGTTLGSLYYMSPEQIQGAVNLDARSDLYSVGVSLYELVTGKRPFDGDSQFAIMSAHLKNTPIPPIALDPALSQALNDVILLSVAKDPNARFQGAAAFRNALASVVGSAAPAPAPVAAAAAAATVAPAPAPAAAPVMVPAPQPARSHRGVWMALGAVAAVGVLVAAIELAPWKGTKAAQPAAVQSTPAAVQTPAAPPAEAQQPLAPAQPPAAEPAVQPVPVPVSPPQRRASAIPKSAQPSIAQPAAAPPQTVAQPAMASNPEPQAASPPQQTPPPQSPVSSQADLDKARDKYDLLQARMTAILGHSIWRAQAASGLGIRSDAKTARALMETYMRNASDAMNGGNAGMAQNYMEKAERQIEVLEKILN
jgi:hypothetical protein